MDRIGRERGRLPLTSERYCDEIEHGSLYVGGPSAVAEKIARMLTDLDVQRLDLKLRAGQLPQEVMTRSIELFAVQSCRRSCLGSCGGSCRGSESCSPRPGDPFPPHQVRYTEYRPAARGVFVAPRSPRAPGSGRWTTAPFARGKVICVTGYLPSAADRRSITSSATRATGSVTLGNIAAGFLPRSITDSVIKN